MIKITVEVTPSEFEKANYILGQAIKEIEDSKHAQKLFQLNEDDLKEASKFRSKLVKSFSSAIHE